MKKMIILLSAMLFLSSVIFAADELELGMAITPLSFSKSASATSMEGMYGTTSSFLQDNLLGLHAGYSMFWLFYGSVDANFLPAWWVKDATEYTDLDGTFHQGVYAPGFITYLDVGIRPAIGNLIIMAEMGINMLYVHSAYDKRDVASKNEAGFNCRVGLGYKFKALSLTLIGTEVFTTFDKMTSTIRGAIDGRQEDIDSIMQGLMPSLAMYLHL